MNKKLQLMMEFQHLWNGLAIYANVFINVAHVAVDQGRSAFGDKGM